jgi:hypothetical protein
VTERLLGGCRNPLSLPERAPLTERSVARGVVGQACSHHTSVCLALTALQTADTPTALHLALAGPGLGRGQFTLAVRREERPLLDNPVYVRGLRLASGAQHAARAPWLIDCAST